MILAHSYIPHVISSKSEAALTQEEGTPLVWSRHAMAGSTDLESYCCAMRSWSTPSWHSTTLRLPSSLYTRLNYRLILFKDNSLIGANTYHGAQLLSCDLPHFSKP